MYGVHLTLMNKPTESNEKRVLSKDHKKLSKLLNKYADSNKITDRAGLAQFLASELHSHLKLEEKMIFPGLSRNPEGERVIGEMLRDHHAMIMIIDELLAICTTKNDVAYQSKLQDLRNGLSAHIEESEHNFLPRATELKTNRPLSH